MRVWVAHTTEVEHRNGGKAMRHDGIREEQGDTRDASEVLASLLNDLVRLRDYLVERGQHTRELAERFLQNADRDRSSREFDQRQATMLEYQHYIWHEIAGQVDKLVSTYEQAHAPQVADAGGVGEPESE